MRMPVALMLAAASCAAAATSAPGGGASARDARVYRCGNLFTETPCPGATTLDVRDPRSEDERRQAQDVVAREKRLADTLEAERHAREAPPAGPAQTRARVVCVAASGPAAGRAVSCPPRRSHDKARAKAPPERASEAWWKAVRVPEPASPAPNLR